MHRPGENRRNLPPLLPVAGHSRQDTVAPLCGRRQAEDSYGILDLGMLEQGWLPGTRLWVVDREKAWVEGVVVSAVSFVP